MIDLKRHTELLCLKGGLLIEVHGSEVGGIQGIGKVITGGVERPTKEREIQHLKDGAADIGRSETCGQCGASSDGVLGAGAFGF